MQSTKIALEFPADRAEAPGPDPSPGKPAPGATMRERLRRTALGATARGLRRLRRGTVEAIGQGRAALGAGSLARLRTLAETDPDRALRLVRRAQALMPRRRLFAEAEALLVARLEGWEAASPRFARLSAKALAGPPATALLREPRPDPALALALPDRDRPAALSREAAARIVLYTAAFGGDRPPPPPAGLPDGIACLCFTDRDILAPGWRVERLAPGAAPPGLGRAFCQIRPDLVIPAVAPDAEASLFVAPEMLVVGNLDTLFARWLSGQDVAAWRHPHCIDWHDLAERHLIAGTGAGEPVLAQARHGSMAGLPRDRGACDTRVLWRRHGAPEVGRLMERWWETFLAAPGETDLALYRALHDPAAPPPTTPKILPAALGTAEDNIFFARPAAGRTPAPCPAAPVVTGRSPLRVAFVYGRPYSTNASTLLRGEQLAALVAAHHTERYAVTYRAETADLRDQVVVLTKGAIWVLRTAEIDALRRRNIAVVASWDDDIPDPEKVRAASAQMALSIRQTLDMRRLFPDTDTHMVTHHVNLRLPPMEPPADRLRTGYFGTLANTVRPESLADMVELNGINPTRAGSNWMDDLSRYNCHWIVRRKQAIDGWKPFLKGFVAARCGAAVIVGREDDDAAYYLGDDYPFYVTSLEPARLEADVVGFAAAFGGPEWRFAQTIMAQVGARSTDALVAAEFKAMIDAVTA
jgi:hypothetical protein